MESIILVGFMGSGKTIVSAVLGEKLSCPVIDTDVAIEEKHKKKIPAIFQMEGEKVFRTYESDILFNLPKEDAIIATGGGIVKSEQNRVWLRKHGTVVHLHTSWEETVKRLASDTDRPLWNNEMDQKCALYKERQPLYEEVSDFTVTTNGKTPESIAKEIIALIKID
ncbi:shikimate kinase [Aquibacillus sp. 3ASR75-11]|uniref:Shikimate kinase n=1 Tax=Terrihalobacillus insolitus TaxID=2950438 RepID=A0A9X4AMM7_9BACI|nr:shikimate kinase [Terrihalobacillus insolitus]MDC3413406.1 shikimate kinase [Terrihalobacillus insolitus]MDC3424989.1 shikimate kinase [Terrihalobacillus insolitus]